MFWSGLHWLWLLHYTLWRVYAAAMCYTAAVGRKAEACIPNLGIFLPFISVEGEHASPKGWKKRPRTSCPLWKRLAAKFNTGQLLKERIFCFSKVSGINSHWRWKNNKRKVQYKLCKASTNVKYLIFQSTSNCLFDFVHFSSYLYQKWPKKCSFLLPMVCWFECHNWR